MLKTTKINSFNVLEIFNTLGYIGKEDIKLKEKQIQRSLASCFHSFLILILTITVPIKMTICLYFDQSDIRNFYFGDWFWMISDFRIKYWLAVGGLVSGIFFFFAN